MILSPANARLVIGIGSSYANVILMALITLLVVPIYVRTLGPGEWGVVALCMTLQGALHAVDVALSPLLLREAARAARHGGEHRVYQHFRRIYAGGAIALFALAQLLVLGLQHAPLISLTPISGELAWALRIGLIQFALQFANNAAIGYWNGLECQRLANARTAFFLLAKHALALLLVCLYAQSAIAYLMPFVAVSAAELVANHRRVLRDRVAASTSDRAEATNRNIGWADLRGFGVAAVIGVLCMQIDRIYLSLALPAEQYGVYYLVSNLMLSLLSLQVPIQRAFLPRMATALAPRQVATPMLLTSVGLLVLPCLLMTPFAEQLLVCWLHAPPIATIAAPSFRWMLVATALIALYAATGAQLISQQRYREMAALNGTALVVQLLLLLTLTPSWGMLAGAFSWVGFGAAQALYAAFVWHQMLSPRP